MAQRHGKDARIYVDAVDFSAYLDTVSISMSADAQEVTTLADAAKTFCDANIPSSSLDGSGFFDGSAGAIDANVHAALASDTEQVVTVLPAGSTDGLPAYFGPVLPNESTVESPVDGVVSITWAADSSDKLDRGTILHALAQETASDTTAAHDGGADTTGGGAAVLHVTAASMTSLDVIIEGSSTGAFGGEEVTLGTFAQVTAAPKAEIITWTGTTHRYVRAKATLVGSSATYHVSYARR